MDTKKIDIQNFRNLANNYYSCMDCEWEGDISECDFDSEYDEFKRIDKNYPICPECGGGLDC